MATIQLIEKSTGQLTDASGKNMLSLVHPCVVKVSASLGYLKSISRNGESLVVHLKSGEVVTIDNFFHDVDGVRNDLVLEEPSNRQLWWANYSDPWDGVELLELGSIDELLIEQSDDLLDLLLLGVGLGAIGLVSGGGGGGGGGGGSKEKNGSVPDAPEILFNNLQGLAGTARPGGIITVHKPDGSSVTTGVNDQGQWAFTPNPLGDGEKGSVTVTDMAGNVSPAVETGVADLTPPAQPSITA
uniref:BapA/Bap/LapF family prefix-like domain-containing protein n=1 Tax=Pseudomonas aeruginosa TaxID=287 RepID=UPI000EB04E91